MTLSLAIAPRSKAALLRERARLGTAVADALRAIAGIDDVLASLEPDDATTTYSSLRLPQDMKHLKNGRRAFATWCRERRPEGARLEGHMWIVEREAWHASRSRVGHRDSKPSNLSDDDALADLALVGMRRTA